MFESSVINKGTAKEKKLVKYSLTHLCFGRSYSLMSLNFDSQKVSSPRTPPRPLPVTVLIASLSASLKPIDQLLDMDRQEPSSKPLDVSGKQPRVDVAYNPWLRKLSELPRVHFDDNNNGDKDDDNMVSGAKDEESNDGGDAIQPCPNRSMLPCKRCGNISSFGRSCTGGKLNRSNQTYITRRIKLI